MGKEISTSNTNNNNYNNNPIKKVTKKCPYCGIVYLYNTQYHMNTYHAHESSCRDIHNKNINPGGGMHYYPHNPYNPHNPHNPQNPLVLTNSLNEFIKSTKKELPRGNKYGTFEEKVDYLRYDISKKKIDFTDGAETLYISRENVLENSIVQLEVLNLFKEIKIIFTGEESSDAGGLIREWLTILFKELLDEKTGLFEKSDTEEISYIIKKNIIGSEETLNKYYFIGRVLAKALLENLTVNCCFNKVIYQLILGEKIEFKDLVFIDKPLYNSLKNLMAIKEECGDNIALCEIYFSYQYKDEKGNMCFQDLIENGNDILVTKDNFDLYVEKRIEFFTKSQLLGVKEIIRGINTIFSVDLLKIFTSDQLGLLINGTPFIDVDDWRLNTQYKNYNDYDNVIVNFWDIISNLSQEDLSNFLLFCTGSSRVPIGGFKSLESNRGQISKFEIVKINYIPGAKNFLRVHTCFNRLDLPEFPDKYSLNEAIKFALENQVLGYGIE
jgi:E3 ubiquitin-protein ligase HUWE1